LVISRLQHRLRTWQLSLLTSLQVQVVSFAVCKEIVIEYHNVNKISFTNLFAQNQN
jgi:hypothetical protein